MALSSNAEQKYFCMEALAKMKDPRVVDLLLSQISEFNSYYLTGTARLLGDLKNPRAVDVLIQALQDPTPITLDYYTPVSYRGTAADNLKTIREEAALALAKIGDPRAVEPLIASLEFGEMRGRSAAAKALGSFKDKRAVEPLIAILDEFPGRACAVSADALKAITGQDFGTDAKKWREWWKGQQ
jgi:HEAT repeat protein